MARIGENWNCPYCGYAQVISAKRFDHNSHRLEVEGEISGERLHLGVTSVVCANSECRELSLKISLGADFRDAAGNFVIVSKQRWTLLPPSSAKPQPDFIPQPIRDDYYEACAIRDLSPKASATITRRCLQGMIRDFCKITKPRLIEEINELRKRVDAGHAPLGVQSDALDAIDAVRKIGNIGAHMESDIGVIIDVDPDEAQILIELVETLLDEWYVAAEHRKTRFGHLQSIAAEKEQQKKG